MLSSRKKGSWTQVLVLFVLVFAGALLLRGSITSLATYEETHTLEVNATLTPESPVRLTFDGRPVSLSVSGSVTGNGAYTILLDGENKSLVVAQGVLLENETRTLTHVCEQTCVLQENVTEIVLRLEGNASAEVTELVYKTIVEKEELRWNGSFSRVEVVQGETYVVNLSEFILPKDAVVTFSTTQTGRIAFSVQNEVLSITPESDFVGRRIVTVLASDGSQVVRNEVTIDVLAAENATRANVSVAQEVIEALGKESEVDVVVILKPVNVTVGGKTKLVDQRIQTRKLQEEVLGNLTAPRKGRYDPQEYDYNVTKTYETLPVIAGTMTQSGLEKLKQSELVAQIVPDDVFSIAMQDALPLINATSVVQETEGGLGLTSCLLDTGVDKTHSELASHVVDGFDFVNNDADAADDSSNSHGTHVAGIIHGVAPNATILPLKVCNAAGQCKLSAVLAGIDYCMNASGVRNISTITAAITDHGSYNATSCPTFMDDILEGVVLTKTLFIAPTGNDGHGAGISYPGCSSFTIAVGATTKQDGIASFTNRGELLDVLAPGVGINSTAIGGGATSLSGTSAAAPFVTGAVILRQEVQGKESIETVRAALRSTGKIIENWRRLDVSVFVQSLPNETTTINVTPPPLLNVSVVSSAANRTINTTFAKIEFKRDVNLTRALECSELTKNSIRVDTVRCPELDVPARIGFYKLQFVRDLQVFRDGVKCAECANVSRYRGEISADVQGFSEYSVNGTETTFQIASTCTTLLTSTTMDSNVQATGSCMLLSNNHIVLDCAGFTISFGETQGGNGVEAGTTKTNLTVKNCNIVNGSSSGSNGISFSSVENSTIFNNSINITGSTNTGIKLNLDIRFMNVTNNSVTSAGIGIDVSGVVFSNFTNNTVYTNISDSGIKIGQSPGSASSDNNFVNNYVSTVGVSGTIGTIGAIHVRLGSNNTFFNNTGSSNFSHGLLLDTGVINNTFINNTFTSNIGEAIYIKGNDDNNTFDGTILASNVTWIFVTDSSGTQPNRENKMSNVTFVDVNGSIKITGNFSINTTMNISRNLLNVSAFNLAFLNSSAQFTNLLNMSGEVTLFNITFRHPHVQRDLYDNGSFENCDSPTCVNLSFNNYRFVFNVSSFTSYRAVDLTICEAINTSVTFNNSINTSTTCIAITSDNLTINCVGYTIGYGLNGSEDSFGVEALNRNNVTIKDCPIRDMNTSGARGFGINFTNVNNSFIWNVSVQTNGTNNSYGIFLLRSLNITVENSTIRTLGSGANNYGIYGNLSAASNLTKNVIITTGSRDNDGLFLEIGCDNTTSLANNISTNGTASYGIKIISSNFSNFNQTILDNAVDWINITNGSVVNNFSNTSFLTLNGSIRIPGIFVPNLSLEVTRAKVNITHNRAFLNSSNLTLLNRTGIIVFTNILATAPTLQVDFNDDGVFETCSAPQCINLTNVTNNQYTFNVSSFTAYRTGDFCRDINVTTTLSSSVSASGTCINITGDNMTLNCAANTIEYDSGGTDSGKYGIVAVGRKNITIKDCVIRDVTSGIQNNYGINFTGTNNSFILGTNITTNGSATAGSAQGIVLRDSSNNTIENNTITTNGGTIANTGLVLTFSSDNNITMNVISTMGTTDSYGMDIIDVSSTVRSEGNSIRNNTIKTNGSGTTNWGISLQLQTINTRTKIIGNTIITNGTTGSSVGIFGNTFANVIIANNTIITDGGVNPNFGLDFQSGSANNNMTNNTIQTAGAASSSGIRVRSGATNNTFIGTNITTSSSNSFGIELVGDGNIFNHTILNNPVEWINQSNTGGTTNNFTNLTFSTPNGTIRIVNNISIVNISEVVRQKLNLTGTVAFLNSTNLSYLNQTAIIIFSNTSSRNATVQVAFNDSTNFAPCGSCTTLSFANNIIEFNVTSFTTYRAVPLSQCDLDINTTTTLNNSINASGTCIQITGDNLTFDCGGFSIGFNLAGGDGSNGIFALNRRNVTIRNCVVRDLNASGRFNYGVNLSSTNFSLVLNNSITTNGSETAPSSSSAAVGIVLGAAANNTIENNSIRTQGSVASGTTDNYGIYVLKSWMTTIYNNTIVTNGSGGDFGIYVQASGVERNVTIVNNTINTTLSAGTGGSAAFGIRGNPLVGGNIANNTIITSGTSISFFTGSVNNTIEKNNISMAISLATDAAIDILALNVATNTVLRENTIRVNGSASGEGINLGSTSSNVSVVNNTIRVVIEGAGAGTSAYGIQTASSGVLNISLNKIFVNGTGTSYAIFLDDGTVNVTAIGNNLTGTDGGGNDSYAINIFQANFSLFNQTIITNSKGWINNTGSKANNFSNTTFVGMNGSINFFDMFSLNGSQDINLKQVNISFNRSFVNVTKFSFLNMSARIELWNLNFSEPRVFRDGNDTNDYKRCPAAICFKESFIRGNGGFNGTLIFNVTGFTSYAGLDNRPPTIGDAVLNTTFGTNFTTENQTSFAVNVNDPDEDVVTNITDWRRNGTSIAFLNMPFETNVTDTTVGAVRDYSIFGNNGTLGGQAAASAPVWRLSGQVGGSYHFDGKNDFINISHHGSQNVKDSFSIEAWVNRSRPCESNCIIVMKQNASGTGCCGNLRYGLAFFNVSGDVSFSFNTGTWDDVVNLTAPLSSGVYHHIVGTYNGSIASIYIDGVLNRSVAKTGDVLQSTGGTIEIGRETVTSGEYFNGTIDEIRIYNRSLSTEQVQQLYTDGLNGRHSENLMRQETRAGDVWSVEVTPNDKLLEAVGNISMNLTVIDCGLVLADHTLIANVSSTGTCFRIGRSNVTLNCLNYTINYDINGTNSQSAVNGLNLNNVTVKNCVMRDINAAGAFDIAVNFTHVNNSFILNNTIFTNGTSGSIGVRLMNTSWNATIENNTIITQGNESDNYGIYLLTEVFNTSIVKNVIRTNGSNNNTGIRLEGNATNTSIINNTITARGWNNNYGVQVLRDSFVTGMQLNSILTRGNESNNYGVYLFSRVLNTTIIRNNISTNGTFNNTGIRLENIATNNTIENNTITTGVQGNNYGLHLITTAAFNSIRLNNITTNGTGNNTGVRIEDAANNNSIVNNSIITDGLSEANFGFHGLTAITGNVIAYNNVTTRGTSNNTGVRMQGFSENNSIENNTIRTQGTADNVGMHFTVASFNRVFNNNITTNGTGNNTGVLLDVTANANSIANNTITTRGSGTENHGVLLRWNVSNSSIINNVIVTNSTRSDGIFLQGVNNNNTFILNNITTLGSLSYGIHIVTSNNTLFNRTILNNPTEWINASVNSITNFTNISFESINGTITPFNFTLRGPFEITQNKLNTTVINQSFLNSTNLTVVNVSSIILLKGITLRRPQAQVALFDNGSFEDCHAPRCFNLSYANTLFMFNVTGFTSYRVAEGCGDINETTTLGNNVSSTETCFRIVSDNVTLDCAGYTIAYNLRGLNFENAIAVENRKNVTIKNCFIRDVNSSGTHGFAINFTTTNNSVLMNNTLITNGTSNSHGLYFLSAQRNNVSENNITINGTASYGITLFESNDSFFNNTVISFGPAWINSSLGSFNNFTNTTFTTPNGSIRFHNFSINYTWDIVAQKVNVTHNKGFVNSTNLQFLNASADITLLNLVGVGQPAIVYDHEDDSQYEKCFHPQCSLISFTNNNAVFNVTKFSAYKVVENVSLTIYDEGTRLEGIQIDFIANITNSTGGSVRPANCSITFNISGQLVDQNMAFNGNGSSVTNRSFGAGVYPYNVTCVVNEERLNASRNVTIKLPEMQGATAGVTAQAVTGGGPSPQPPAVAIAPPKPPVLEFPAFFIPPIKVNATQVACAQLVVREPNKTVAVRTSEGVPFKIPKGFELVMKPLELECSDSSIDLTVNVPDTFTDIRPLRCEGDVCRDIVESEEVKEELACGGISLSELHKEKRRDSSEVKHAIERGKIITSKDRTFEEAGIKTTFTGELPKLIVEVGEVSTALPQNPGLSSIGSPVSMMLVASDERALPATIQVTLPELQNVESGSEAVYAFVDGSWINLGSSITIQNGTNLSQTNATRVLQTAVLDMRDLLDEQNKTTIGVMGVTCTACTIAEFRKEYDGSGSRNVIVLVHGLLNDPDTWGTLIDEYARTNQPWQIWTLNYPSTTTVEQTARELRDALELHAAEFDSVTLVGHSLGGFVIEDMLEKAAFGPAPYSFVEKVKKVVLIAVPHDGSPAIDIYRNYFNFLTQNEKTNGIFNLDSAVVKDLTEGMQRRRLEHVEYFVIAGTQPYEFNLGFYTVKTAQWANFTLPNDGVTTTIGAQHVGGLYINDTCKNYYELNLTHTDLLYHPLARRVLSRIIAKDVEAEEPLLGFNQYLRLRVNNCKSSERIVVIGRKLSEQEVQAPVQCNCGNGVCGMGEDDLSCPVDCAVGLRTKENICLLLPPAVYVLLILNSLVVGGYLLDKYLYRHTRKLEMRKASVGLVGATLTVNIVQNVLCKSPLVATYFVLVLLGALLGLDAFVSHLKRLHKFVIERRYQLLRKRFAVLRAQPAIPRKVVRVQLLTANKIREFFWFVIARSVRIVAFVAVSCVRGIAWVVHEVGHQVRDILFAPRSVGAARERMRELNKQLDTVMSDVRRKEERKKAVIAYGRRVMKGMQAFGKRVFSLMHGVYQVVRHERAHDVQEARERTRDLADELRSMQEQVHQEKEVEQVLKQKEAREQAEYGEIVKAILWQIRKNTRSVIRKLLGSRQPKSVDVAQMIEHARERAQQLQETEVVGKKANHSRLRVQVFKALVQLRKEVQEQLVQARRKTRVLAKRIVKGIVQSKQEKLHRPVQDVQQEVQAVLQDLEKAQGLERHVHKWSAAKKLHKVLRRVAVACEQGAIHACTLGRKVRRMLRAQLKKQHKIDQRQIVAGQVKTSQLIKELNALKSETKVPVEKQVKSEGIKSTIGDFVKQVQKSEKHVLKSAKDAVVVFEDGVKKTRGVSRAVTRVITKKTEEVIDQSNNVIEKVRQKFGPGIDDVYAEAENILQELKNLQKSKGVQDKNNPVLNKEKPQQEVRIPSVFEGKEVLVDQQELKEVHRLLEQVKKDLNMAKEKKEKESVIKEENPVQEEKQPELVSDDIREKLKKIKQVVSQIKEKEAENETEEKQ